MAAVYKFMYRGRWVAEKSGHYFWTQTWHSNSVLKYLLYEVLHSLLSWACLRLTGEWLLPEKFLGVYPYPPGIIVLLRGRVFIDPVAGLDDFFWLRNLYQHEKKRPRTSCPIPELVHVEWRSHRYSLQEDGPA